MEMKKINSYQCTEYALLLDHTKVSVKNNIIL